MRLFKDVELLEAVSPKNIRDLTGISAEDFSFESYDPEKELDELLSQWIEQIASHVHARVGKQFAKADIEYHAIRDIIIRTVAKVVAIAQQQRTSPIVQMDDFAISILNTSDVTKNLDDELKPFKQSKTRIKIFSSSGEYQE